MDSDHEPLPPLRIVAVARSVPISVSRMGDEQVSVDGFMEQSDMEPGMMWFAVA